MKEKKEMSNALVYLLILFLLIFIVVPPVFRTFVPKREESILNTPKEKVVLLTCNKTSEGGQYQISSKTKFLSGEASGVTLTYQKAVSNNNSTLENSEVTPVLPDATVEAELEVFRNLADATIIEDESKFSITMTQNTVASNSDVEVLNHYFGLLPNQKKYYEGLGYTCTKVES